MNLQVKAARIYAGMMDRCYNKNNKGYKNYGGRGIDISEEWLSNPKSFFEWYERNYFEHAQVDRIDNDKGYSENNCRMCTRTENVRNRRTTVALEFNGERKPLASWLEDPSVTKGLTYSVALRRYHLGWSDEEILTIPVDFQQSVKRTDRNKSGNIRGQMPDVEKLTAFGESKTLHEWSIDPRCKVDKKTLWYRKSNGWDVEKAITQPPAKNAGQLYEGKSVLQWSKDPQCQVSYKVLNSRLKKGIPLATALKA